MNTSRLVPFVRRFSTSIMKTSNEVLPGYVKQKERQKMFQIDNGLRIHERGGMTDKLLYNLTTALIVIGAGVYVQSLYQMAFPPKN